ncbi:MAG: ATP-binding protein [Candidatus Sulfotelmatobacter sp.]
MKTKVSATAAPVDTVSIRPGVSILSVLRHLNYKPWYALAEFVDNSLQSYLDNEEALQRADGNRTRLRVEVELDTSGPPRMTVRDNAAGIRQAEYRRAFRPAAIPTDRSGLSEFGMGMKSAACWFAPQWTVRTSALGETVERTVEFDIDKIVKDNLEELAISSRAAPSTSHFTEIALLNLHQPPQGRTVSKIKEHLGSIYRIYLRDEVLELLFDGELLLYPQPRILVAPFYRTPKAEPRKWEKQIELDFGRDLRVSGFAAIRETASTSGAGFSLFRRGRLIEGSVDEGYRPEQIFGKSNSYRYQRLFGELHLEGFEISHTKDGFRWEEHEETFLSLLNEELDAEPLPLLDMAEGHRVRQKPDELRRSADKAAGRTAEVIEHEVPPVLESELNKDPESSPPPQTLPARQTATSRDIPIELNGARWRIKLELTSDPAVGDWLSVSDKTTGQNLSTERVVGVRVSLAHPFMERFAGSDVENIEALVRLAAALGLAEIAARDRGVRQAGTIRRIINELVRDALAKP